MQQKQLAGMEFHISRRARARYQFDKALFSSSGNAILADFHAARVFAQKMNAQRNLDLAPEHAVKAGQINAMGLIDEFLHQVVASYRQTENPMVMKQALHHLDAELGRERVDSTLRRFADEFPPVAVYQGEISPEAYFQGQTGGVSHREILLEEMLLLWLANANPALAPFRELFDDASLVTETAYEDVVAGMRSFFAGQPGIGAEHLSLFDMLRSPALAAPHSLSGQLEFIRVRWRIQLGHHLQRLLRSLDLVREEEKPSFAGPGPTPVVEFGRAQAEPEQFSPDLDWMPRLVLLAKNAYVWLYQLTEKYERPIARLDQIPDMELDLLAGWGMTGLWLIGLWERSSASARIKQLCGNPEAVASAYSLYDYQIAEDLGGQTAFDHLKERAWRRGIRLASDMVPNHVGIYSRWVIEHPDWFISLDRSPFPAHHFSGPDLSNDERVGIFVEDHYYDRTDAAVVFRRVDRWTGQEQYIYHGNDGTSMPWNDTAQLNYLNPEVREAIIQTILHVARQTPIIRFDAAMTLTKKHFQRLWFPEPGTGGAIPTRAEHGLTRAEFDSAMPNEFWREVVDRVATEAPDTLLLAEAFWLLEGYFVRTLGMHRVYNSAFMHMLRDEENAKYRTVIKNTLEFDPEILKRFVSFMNNPDEETAVAQFGKGDKYFGICTLMATLPGLPMFGHGQVEGLAERYGMEYRRAYWDEKPDDHLVERHKRQIFPLLHRRHLFAEVENFRLYDFFASDGTVNEDVFAYSNLRGPQRALILYHNRYASTRGWLKASAAYSVKTGKGDLRALVQTRLGDDLGLHHDAGYFSIFRDYATGLEYIRSSKALCEDGLYAELEAYQCHAFLDWREVQDDATHPYALLNTFLNGRGVSSIEQALQEVLLQPVLEPFRMVVNAEILRRLAVRSAQPDAPVDAALLDEIGQRTLRLLCAIKDYAGGTGDENAIAGRLRLELEFCLRFPGPDSGGPAQGLEAPARFPHPLDSSFWGSLFGWYSLHALGLAESEAGFSERSRRWMDEWLLGRNLESALLACGLDAHQAARCVLVVQILVSHQTWCDEFPPSQSQPYDLVRSLLEDADVQRFLQVNRYEGILWFNQEAFEELLDWLLRVAEIGLHTTPLRPSAEVRSRAASARDLLELLRSAGRQSGFQVEKLQELLQ